MGPAVPNPADGVNFDAVVVGTGFGGAVTICRLAQAGLRVCVLERGRRYALSDLPALPRPDEFMPDPRRWTWGGSQGLWDIRNLEGVMVAQAAAYGGGSLVYANVHLRPPASVFNHHDWPRDCWDRGPALDTCFDLVAYMLQVQPIPVAWQTVGKTAAMTGAFQQAVGQAGVFFPPLAIQFPAVPPGGAPRPPPPPIDEGQLPLNPHGRPQGDCVRCGACDLGCRYGAKNTLDRNYLADAEATGNVEVHTLAEALMISQAGAGYRVDYRDHLTETNQQVSGRYLFLCAGAVNTAELLLRSTPGGRSPYVDPALGPGLPNPIGHVGEDYFVNADSLAMVFDTDRAVEPDGGPVITTALVHSEEPRPQHLRARRRPLGLGRGQGAVLDRREWFMVQDGGFPREVARFFGAFASPALLGRNRFDPGGPPPNLIARGGLPRGPRPDRYQNVLDGFYGAVREHQLPDVLPNDLHRARDALMETWGGLRDDEIGNLVEAVRNEVILRSPFFRLSHWLRLDRVRALNWLAWRVALWIMGARRDRLLATTLDVTRHRYGTDDPDSLPARIGRLLIGEGYPVEDPVRGPPLHPPPAPQRLLDHRALLLAMGKDDVPATIRINTNPNQDRLEVVFPDDSFRTLADEERVMRDVAAALGGSLRTSPIWAFARQPITAHSHGGCALRVVTDDFGQVRGYQNLYINDGALLPTPVGVNPSGTIAAVAERNMLHFVTSVLDRPIPPVWNAQRAAAGAWIATQQRNGVVFVPPAGGNQVGQHETIGVSFHEMMSGFLSAVQPAGPGLLPDYRTARVQVPPFLVAEGTARSAAAGTANAAAAMAAFDCQARLVDIGAFLDDPNHPIDLTGNVTLPAGLLGANAPGGAFPIVAGTLHLFATATPIRRMMLYYLQFDCQGQRYTLVGHKEIQDDPGFDAWLDASTLYTEVYRGVVAPNPPPYPGQVVARGILRLGTVDFLHNQAQGLHAEGTTDPARVIWTLGSFGLFFFGTMQKTYSPEIERFLDLFTRKGWRAVEGGTRAPRTLHLMRGL